MEFLIAVDAKLVHLPFSKHVAMTGVGMAAPIVGSSCVTGYGNRRRHSA